MLSMLPDFERVNSVLTFFLSRYYHAKYEAQSQSPRCVPGANPLRVTRQAFAPTSINQAIKISIFFVSSTRSWAWPVPCTVSQPRYRHRFPAEQRPFPSSSGPLAYSRRTALKMQKSDALAVHQKKYCTMYRAVVVEDSEHHS